MVEEMIALHNNDTWDLVPLPPGQSTVSCCWIYIVKVGLDGQVDRLKTRLVANEYIQTYGVDYFNIFSLMTKMSSVHQLLSMVAIQRWHLFQLGIKNAFLHYELQGDFYME